MGKMKNFLNMVKTYPHVDLHEIEANMDADLRWFYEYSMCGDNGAYPWIVGQDGHGWDTLEDDEVNPAGNADHINECMYILGFQKGDIVFIDIEF